MSELPEGWAYCPLGELSTIQSGVGFPKKFQGYSSGELPVYKVGDLSKAFLNERGVLDRAEHYVSLEVANEMKGKVFPVGSTLFAKIGEALRLNRRVSVLVSGLADNNVMGVIPYKEECKPYIYRFLQNYDIASLSRSTTVPSIRKSDVENIQIALPPLNEQTRIANKLDSLLTKVQDTQTRLEKIPSILKRFRQSVLAAATSGELTKEWRKTNVHSVAAVNFLEIWRDIYIADGRKFREPKISHNHDEGPDLPAGWKRLHLGEICDVYVGATPSRKESSYWSGSINWVSSSEVAFNRIKSTQERVTKKGLANTSTHIHPVGTVMLAMIGQGKTRGQAAILDIEACHNQNTAALRVLPDHLVAEYLYFFLWSQYENNRKIGGGNNQKALNKSIIQNIPFPCPSFKEQKEIVGIVESLFALADKVEKQYQAAKQRTDRLTQSLLAKAFRGELVPQDPNDEPASELLKRIQAEREKVAIKKQKR